MSKITVDVVLLPCDEMMYKTIQANAELVEKFGSEIVLNKTDCLPHISLAMGCIDERNISHIEKVLELIAGENPLGKLKIPGIRTSANAKGEIVSVFEIEKTKRLQTLHEKVMKKVKPYFSYDVTEDMIYNKKATETTLLWIKNYPEKASFANFLPHVTLGYGEIQNGPFPTEFIATRLALCHLGNHCTCRKILVSIVFGNWCTAP